MHFTAQQLAGGQRYGHSTRVSIIHGGSTSRVAQVGNWLEDLELEEEKRAEFGRSQAAGMLVMSQMSAKAAAYQRPVELSSCPAGQLKFGSVVKVAHAATGSSLAVDLTESVLEGDPEGRLVTASPMRSPVARTTFKVRPVEEDAGDVVRFGQPFYLESLVEEGYFLSSTLKSSFNASRLANQQAVSMRPGPSPAAVWTAQKICRENTGVLRHLLTTEPIPVSAFLGDCPVVLQHRSTKQGLACDRRFADMTDFGRELEVTCHNHHGKEKVEILCSEMQGKSTPATTSRLEQEANYWQFLVNDT